jgi:hypothetical protein
VLPDRPRLRVVVKKPRQGTWRKNPDLQGVATEDDRSFAGSREVWAGFSIPRRLFGPFFGVQFGIQNMPVFAVKIVEFAAQVPNALLQ